MPPIGNISPGGSIALGILVGLISTSVQSLGLTLQRKSHILEDEKGPHDVRRPPYRRRRWQVGMAMFVIANILGSTVQISTLPLPVLSTLQAAGLVFNSICATLILSEPFTRWSLCGTLLVSSGAVLIAFFGAIPSPAHELDELLELLARKPFIVWMIIQALFVVTLAVVTDVTSSVSSLSHNARFRLIRGISYGVISGDLSAHSLLFAKSAVELLIKTIGGKNQFLRWQSWTIVLALVSLALCQLYYLHRGLKLVSTSVLYPLVFCVYNIIAILDGLIYFNQMGLISALDACLITLGTVILLSGVLALSWRLSDEQHAPAVATLEVDEELPSATYQTFPVMHGEAAPLTPARKKSLSWVERDEIWGELQDQDEPTTPAGRLRSTTFPARTESTPLLPQVRRAMSGVSVTDQPGPSADASPRRFARRRRKSTGFPGLVARRNLRRDSAFSETLGGFFSMNWLRRNNSRASVSGGPLNEGNPPQQSYRDEPEGDSNGSANDPSV
ncbi:hypothetical protein TgHK011_008446 [Trichoderma gracile]|nr:hypothetical protein TgHK011_008446 [Trichoderma gracile]